MATDAVGVIRPARPVAREDRSRSIALSRSATETLGIFVVLTAAYTLLGVRVVAGQHVVIGDALSRLAHAYFVFHNDPPKLAAIGFAWPPIQTLAYLPFAIVKPMATSLWALSLYSAVFGAGTITILNRTLAGLGLSGRQRLLLLGAFACNPMWAWYSANGMSEMPYLFLLTVAFAAFVRYSKDRQQHQIMLIGIALGLGFLTRYELLGWVFLLIAAVTVLLVRRHRSGDELEGTMLAFLVPPVFAVLMWCFFSALIVHDPFFWFKDNFSANLAGSAEGTARVATATDTAHAITLGFAMGKVVILNLQLFLPTLVLLPVLLSAGIVRRDLGAVTLACAAGLNAVMTLVLMMKAQDEFLLQLRYNMRAMPLVVLSMGYIIYLARGRWRSVAFGACLVLTVAAIPLTWQTMANWPDRYYEGAFIRALSHGGDLEGTSSRGGYFQAYGIGIEPERRMASYISAHVDAEDQVLTDDRWTFGVMLAGGRPEEYFDRIDRGDGPWNERLQDPHGKVRYILLSRAPVDLVTKRYPLLLRAGQLGFHKVADTGPFLLYRVDRMPARASSVAGATA